MTKFSKDFSSIFVNKYESNILFDGVVNSYIYLLDVNFIYINFNFIATKFYCYIVSAQNHENHWLFLYF